MKTKADLQKEIAEISYQLLALSCKLASAPDEVKTEWPKRGDRYSLIADDGSVSCECVITNNGVDQRRLEFGNVFKTVEAAEKEAAYLKFERSVRAKAAELNEGWVADWGNTEQWKYAINYSGSKLSIDSWCETIITLIRGAECKDLQIAKALLNHFGADKFLSYATGGDL